MPWGEALAAGLVTHRASGLCLRTSGLAPSLYSLLLHRDTQRHWQRLPHSCLRLRRPSCLQGAWLPGRASSSPAEDLRQLLPLSRQRHEFCLPHLQPPAAFRSLEEGGAHSLTSSASCMTISSSAVTLSWFSSPLLFFLCLLTHWSLSYTFTCGSPHPSYHVHSLVFTPTQTPSRFP